MEYHERRTRTNGEVECPQCGAMIPLEEETEEWLQTSDGLWMHLSYGPGHGFCEPCGLAFHDGFDGCFAIDLSNQEAEQSAKR